jgi:uncharacterized protein YqeY
MSLTNKISDDLKTAMKAGEKLRVETLRMIRAALLELQKSGSEVTAEGELKAVQNQAKRRKDAAEQYRNANRADLAEKEEAELKIIEEYLPQQMGEDEIRSEIRKIIEENGAAGPNDFKVVMPKAMGAMRGRADGSKVQAIVKEELEAKGGSA